MSLVRGSRSQAAGRGRRKKAAAVPRREWDSTISDLSVHRASPEELARRRHSRLPRNRRPGLHKARSAPGHPPLVSELLLDRRQLHDVLDRSDRALALVRDLFADGPRLHAAFPNVTAAPGGGGEAALPTRAWGERPTQLSLLSESVMDSQALNDVSPDRAEASPEGGGPGPGQSPGSPCTPEREASGDEAGLNATTAIRRVRSAGAAGQGLGPSPAPERGRLSLEGLRDTMEHIDRELVELQRQAGRRAPPERGRARGLTGFTASLVGSLSRLTRYLKENETRQRREREGRLRLAERCTEQRALIDALTAELLHMQGEVTATQAALHQHMVKTDEELHFIKQAVHGSPGAEMDPPKPRENIDACQVGAATLEGRSCTYCGRQDNRNAPILRAVPNAAERLETIGNRYEGNVLEIAGSGECLPEHLFGSAILLSPPRQRDSQIAVRSQTAANTCQERPLADNVCLKSNCAHPLQVGQETPTSVEQQRENDFIEYLGVQSELQGQQDLAQQCNFRDALEGQRNLTPVLPVSNWSEMQQSGTVNAVTGVPGLRENKMEAEALDKWLKHEAMLAQITELQLQNSALKAQLSQFNIDKLPNSAPQIEKTVPRPCDNLQQRITELNHQSAEARSKLLKLIEQQRQISGDSASPPISPIPPEGLWTETGKKSLDVLIPLPNGLDSSSESAPCPSSEINNRLTDNASRTSSSLHLDKGDGNRTSITQRLKPERLKEEGWFALSTHTI
ncbi:spindle and centriole-associated protein 1 [Hemiscyllium ocellatum]|uniref:spindle and centriole-associated protein 1 n=1 Tax=Hemiscyllium ocellatum TaxID=170820 RepID=UPI00296693ED|nr:spindle and centriole-associated protein 1 [Hemiscyllium ocellatum]